MKYGTSATAKVFNGVTMLGSGRDGVAPALLGSARRRRSSGRHGRARMAATKGEGETTLAVMWHKRASWRCASAESVHNN